jgi:hypothetical protein
MATTEIKLLNPRQRNVNSVIKAALINGVRRRSQGKFIFLAH